MLPWFTSQSVPLLRILTDRGTEYCGKVEHHAYPLHLAVEDIDHSKTKARHPQTNGICERFHRTIKEAFYDIAFRKKIYHSLDELQQDVDEWIKKYNERRPHSGKYCYGKTPMQTFLDSKHLAQEKQLDPLSKNEDNDVNKKSIAPFEVLVKSEMHQGAKRGEISKKSSGLSDRQLVW